VAVRLRPALASALSKIWACGNGTSESRPATSSVAGSPCRACRESTGRDNARAAAPKIIRASLPDYGPITACSVCTSVTQ
jgi:hypothetical protein